ncbi:MAG: sensor domain-containing diguanylate cyclase [Holophagales bacterium]|jgi:diguanylate cyclase (GGDEF)-like protein|nr:sensor domain-containing diguanylate cyclase [Holophagales bacterium]
MDNASLTEHSYEVHGAPAFVGLDPYATALHKALEIFISYTERTFEDVMSNGLNTIADVVDIDRLLVVRARSRERATPGEIYRWDRAKGGTRPIDDELKELPLTMPLRRWIEVMRKDSCVSLRRSEFTEEEAAFLTPRGVMSILIVPVFIEGEIWGVVTFHDNRNEREFDEACTALLRSVARLCVSTIIREEKTKSLDLAMESLKRREMMTNALNMASLIFLSESEKKFADMMHSGVGLIADVADVDRVVLYRNYAIQEKMYSSQVYRWTKDEGEGTELVEALKKVPFAQVMPNWDAHFVNTTLVNSPSRLLDDPERATLLKFGILSVVVIIIYINNSFWGFVIFGDTRRERHFEDDVAEMLRSAAFLFANAFIRAEGDYDGFTGIHNRQFFDRSIKSLIKQHSRGEDILSLMMIDIDCFKQYNDTHGHVEGDKCLKTVAQTLTQCLKREDDFVARYGGDEFVVVLPNTPENGARKMADKMLDKIRGCNMPHGKNEASKYVTISIGVTTGKVSHTDKPDDFVKKADEMLYESKRNGRNRYSFDAKPLHSN